LFNRKKKSTPQESEQNQPEQSASGLDTEEAQSSQAAQSAQGAGLVVESRDWYRDRFRQVATICMVLVLLLIVSLAANAIQVISSPRPQYFAVTDDLRIKKLQPLDEPAISQSGLFNWTTRTVTETFSLDFVHWRKQLMDVKPHFTDEAFGELINSLKNSGNLKMIKERKLVLSATVRRSPVVKAKGVVDGRMTWKLEFPVTFTFESSERAVASQNLVCNVMVQRVSTVNHPRGIKIVQLVMK
jgi:intracellular multiplication protein IcmL